MINAHKLGLVEAQRPLVVRPSTMKVILNETMLSGFHGGISFSSKQLHVSHVHTLARYKVNFFKKKVNFSTFEKKT